MKHPTAARDLTPLEIILWRFRFVARENETMLRGYREVEDVARDIPDNLLFSLANHGLILICKFLEVWHDFGGVAGAVPRVVNVRKAVHPLIERIEVWPGLTSFRNTMLAHAYLDKTGRPVGPWPALYDHKAPTYHAEVLLLQHALHMAIAAVLACFEAEYQSIRPLIGPEKRPDPSPGPGVQLGSEIQPALKALALEVDRRLASIGVVIKGPLAKEFAGMFEQRPKPRAA